MRPHISGSLEAKVEERMEDSSFDTAGEYVRYCIRKELDDV